MPVSAVFVSWGTSRIVSFEWNLQNARRIRLITHIGAYRATSIVCSVLVLCFVIFVAPSPEIHWKPFQIFPELRWNFSYIDPSPVRAILTLNSVQEHWDGSIIGACSPGLGQFVVLSCFITANGSKVWVGMKFGNFNLSSSQRKGESWLQHAPVFQRGRLLETRGFKWLFRFLSCIEYDDAASIA